MRKNKLHKQILSFFVVCAIIFGSIPSISFAEDMSVEQDTAQPAQAAEGQAAAEVVQNTEDPAEGTAEPTEQQAEEIAGSPEQQAEGVADGSEEQAAQSTEQQAVEEAPQEGQGTGEQQPEAPGQSDAYVPDAQTADEAQTSAEGSSDGSEGLPAEAQGETNQPENENPAPDGSKKEEKPSAEGESDKKENDQTADSETSEDSAEQDAEQEAEIPVQMTAQSFSGSTRELNVWAEVTAGVFPEGTTMRVKEATKQELEQVIAEEEAVDAIAADISFFDKDGNEIQPADGTTVKVTLTAKRLVEGDIHEAVTMDERGNTETVGEATSVQTTFDAEHFTIYAIIGKDEEPALLTVNFYDNDGNLLSTQIVKNGDTLLEPEVPAEIDQKVFAGWYEKDAESAYNGFGTVSGVTETAELNLTARYSEAVVHVIYHDQLDNVVDSVEVPANGSVEVLSDSPIVKTTRDAECHVGWATEKGGTENVAGTLNVGEKDINLYPIVKEGYWVTFDTNGGTAYNRQFIALDAEGDDKKAKDPGKPVKEGYFFDGWYADEACTEEFDFAQDIISNVTVYAKWTEDPDTYYVVKYYIEYQSDIASDTWDYKLVTSEVRTAPKGSDAAYDDNLIFSDPYSYNKSGYALNEEKTEKDVKVADDGSTVWDIYYQCNTYNITTIIPLVDGTTYTLTMPAKYTADLGYYWDEVAKHRDLNDLFDGAHRFEYGPYSLFVDSVNALKTMTVTYSLTNGRWVSKPNRTLNYRFWCETLEGVAPEGKVADSNHSARQLLGTITDDRTYYLAEEGSIGDDPQLLTHGPYNEYKGFRVWLPYSDGNFLLYANEWYTFFHAGTRYASVIYGVTNEKGINMYGYYPEGDIWEGGAYYNDADGYYDFYCPRESYDLTFHDGDKDPETTKVLYEKALAEFDPAVTKPDEYTPGVSRRINPDGQEFVFDGWYTEPQLVNKFDFAGTTMPYMNVDVYAKWVPVSYKVTFKYENGDPDEVVENVAYGTAVPKPEDPTYEDHVFLGWTLDGRPYNFDSGVSKDITLVAKWRSINAYQVVYDLNGGSGTVPTDDQNYYKDSEVIVLSAEGITAPAGKVFLGWKSSGDGNIYYANGLATMPLGGLTLTAQWGDVDETVDLVYDFNFDSIGYTGEGEKSAAIKALINNGNVIVSQYPALGGEVPDGYTFKTWNTKADGSGIDAAPGDKIYVDNRGENRLFAIWEKEPEPEEQKPAFTITKVTTSKAKAADGKYVPGESITYKITVKNTGNVTLKNIVITDDLTGDKFDPIVSLEPGAEKELIPKAYVVTEADVKAGKVVNEATGTADNPLDPNPDPDKPNPDYPPITPDKPGTTEDPTKEPEKEPEKDMTPVVVNEPAVTKVITGDKPEEAETFKFTFTRDDKSYPMPNGAKGDTLTLSINGEGTAEVGQITFAQTGTYTYTIKEVNTGKTGYGYDGSVYKIKYEVKENTSSRILSAARTITKDGAPVKDQKAVSFKFTNSFKAAPKTPHLTVTKTVISTPCNKISYQVGEKVCYKISVKNDGNVTIDDVVLKDALTCDEWSIGTLAPGKTAERETSYIVTAADAARGCVENIATATGTGPDPDNPKVPVTEARVTVPVSSAICTPQSTASPGEGQKGAPVDAPRTGDDNQAMMYILLLLAAIGAACGAWGATRKREKEKIK